MEPVGQTERGTPVYYLEEEVSKDILPLRRQPPPRGQFAIYLHTRFDPPACVIVKHGTYTRIFKLSPSGDVFPVTASSIRAEDRRDLIEKGILPGR